MDNLALHVKWIESNGIKPVDWLGKNVATWESVAQLALIGVLIFVAHALAKRSAAWLEVKLARRNHRSIVRIHASYLEIFSLCYSIFLLWAAVLMAKGIGLPANILHIVASLVTAWGVIRFTSSTIASVFWARTVALTLWFMVALNIMGWLDQTISLLDKAVITIGDFKLSFLLVIKSLLAFAILFWAVGFISGVLERTFGRAHGLTPSQRVLFNKIANIALYTICALIGLNILGLDLTAFTVFSGALGLGIGFGLQKVFSNLISGIILLIDKSVKPGDVIAIGDTYGWVNSLGGRYVSVLTSDGKEHLIPNEDLISHQVENWSHSKKNIRIHIPVGVAYGSNIQKVKELLLQASSEHPRILKNPKPVCLIKGFGDSSIDHEVRAWIDDPENGVSNVKSDIYYRIYDLFTEHGVEIPFPQRDINFKADFVEKLALMIAAKAKDH